MIISKIKLALLGLSLTLLTGCVDKEPDTDKDKDKKYVASFECKQENVLAPKWTCIPDVPGFYAGVGIAEKSRAGTAHMKKVAMMNGRSDLTQQINTVVKDKMEGYTSATGNGDNETVDMVTTSVTIQLAKVNLKGSKAVDSWNAPSGALYLLVTIPEKNVNALVKDGVNSSINNDDARWQQYRSQDAIDKLNQSFPTD